MPMWHLLKADGCGYPAFMPLTTTTTTVVDRLCEGLT
jgi:hypothetical protein